ncbi:MAG: class I SAM-dependent methyltransferase [Lachnospiraceae bacterium]
MKLSKRMQAVADLVKKGTIVADIGTDHGYLPIYLIEEKISKRALAMDINKGPLERAKEHIHSHRLQEYIEVRQSDGITNLIPGEATSIIIAGMGGKLILKIIEEGMLHRPWIEEFILQPQSDVEQVRRYLYANDYEISKEDMVLEDGKYYHILRAVPGVTGEKEECRDLFFQYGGYLLKNHHPILLDYLKKERGTLTEILDCLEKKQPESHIEQRIQELRTKIKQNEDAMNYMDEEEGIYGADV